MARSVRGEIVRADIELARFIRAQHVEAERLGYPRQAAFAKLVSSGTVRAPTPPDDPATVAVGDFFWSRTDVQRRVLVDRYSPGTEHEKAHRASMSIRRMRVEIDRLLTALSGWLQAKGV
jgi:hypothetical protein